MTIVSYRDSASIWMQCLCMRVCGGKCDCILHPRTVFSFSLPENLTLSPAAAALANDAAGAAAGAAAVDMMNV